MSIRKRGRYWAVLDAEESLVCLAVYRKGAAEVVRRLAVAARCAAPEAPAPSPRSGAGDGP